VSEGHGQNLADIGLWRDDMLWLMPAMFARLFRPSLFTPASRPITAQPTVNDHAGLMYIQTALGTSIKGSVAKGLKVAEPVDERRRGPGTR
jgi:hypothetical protein